MSEITLKLSLEDCNKITGALLILHKIDEQAQLKIVVERINYWVLDSLKKELKGEVSK